MASQKGNAAAAEARGVPEFNLLGGTVDRENSLTSASTQATPRSGGAKHRQKGDRIERELVDRHKAVGVHAERYPLSGATRFRGTGHDIDIYVFGKEAAPIVAEVKGRKSGAGFTTLEKWLGDYDALFLKRNNAEPLVCVPWRVWVALLGRAPR